MVDENETAKRRHELLATIAEAAATRLIERHGLSADTAADVGNDLADVIADRFGGQGIYFVKDVAFTLDARDRQIFAEMGRGKAHEIAQRHGISYVRVTQIYRRVLAELRKRSQHDLFGAEGVDENAAMLKLSTADSQGNPPGS